jgi:hypothetical protein
MQKENGRLSRLRQSLLRLKEEISRLLPIFLARDPLVPGTVYELRRKCGKPGCGCAKKDLHSSWALSWSEEGRTRLRSIPPGRRVELRLLSRRYQQFRGARARLVKIHQEMIGIINQMEVLRRKAP